MVMGLAIQTIMGPVTLVENALVRTVLAKGSAALTPESAIFDETTTLDESAASDCEIVDEQGNPVVRRSSANNNNKAIQANNATGSEKSLEDILLDTWDQGVHANLKPLLSAITEQNVNYQTSGDHWTALMIVSGLNCPGAADAIQQLRTKYKADVSLTDKDGWTALHWAAFHNSEIAAQELRNESALLSVKDKDGKTPAETARAEGNGTIVALLQPESKKSQ
jgi:ankyrin repeat protein